MHDLTDWTKDDFLSLLSLCGAKADMKISEDEVEWIIKYFGEASYKKASEVHEKQSDYENLQTLIKLKDRFYEDNRGEEEIMGNLKALFSADGEYSVMEKTFERAIKRLF